MKLSVDATVKHIRRFLIDMSKPTLKEKELGVSLLTIDHIKDRPESRQPQSSITAVVDDQQQ